MPIAVDKFAPPRGDYSQIGVNTPYVGGQLITPIDGAGNELPQVTRAIVVGTAGLLNVILADNSTFLMPVLAGTYPLRVRQVLLTGTTAANLTALW